MVKKIIKSKLFWLIIFIVFCFSSIITFCLVSTNKINSGKKYYAEIDTKESEIIYDNFYMVKKEDVYSETSYDAFIEEKENMIVSYKVDILEIINYSEIEENQKIGTYDGNDVLSSGKGYVLNITNQDGFSLVDVYYYNQITIKVEISEGQYAKKEFLNNQQYYLACDSKREEIQFLCYDISEYKDSKKIYGVFNTIDCEMIVSSSSYVSVIGVEKKYSDAFTLDASLFNNQISGKYFVYYDNGKAKNVSIYCTDIINNKAIIESLSSDYTLHEGDLLYVR